MVLVLHVFSFFGDSGSSGILMVLVVHSVVGILVLHGFLWFCLFIVFLGY